MNIHQEALRREASEYVLTGDFHTHTTFSHGTGSIEDNVKTAVSKGLETIAISDHGPGHLTYGIKRRDIPVMRSRIDGLKGKYPQIKILLSVEANIISAFPYTDIKPEEAAQLDFLIAGYHYGIPRGHCIPNWLNAHGFPSNHRRLLVKNTDMVLRCIYQNDIKILTHPGDKGPFDIAEIAKACEETDTLMEINMKHPHLTTEEIRVAAKRDVKFIISSDAHRPENVGLYEGGLQRALAAGLDPGRIVNIRRR